MVKEVEIGLGQNCQEGRCSDLGGSDNDSEEEEGVRVWPRFLVRAAGKGILFSKLEMLGGLTVEMLNLRHGEAHRRKHGVH